MSKKKKSPTPAVPAAPVNPWMMPAAFAGPLFLIWGLVVLYFYLGTHPFNLGFISWFIDQLSMARLFHPYMGKVTVSAAVAFAIAAVTWGGGRWLLERIWPGELSTPAEAASAGGAIGVGVLSCLVWILGALRLWYPGTFAGILGLGLIFLMAHRFRSSAGSRPSHRTLWTGSGVWIGLVAIFFLSFFMGELTPETFYDAQYYHVAVPNLYRIAHRIYDIPTMLFSNFVLTVQLYFGWALTLGTTITAKLLHGFLGLLLLAAFLAMEGPAVSAGAGWLAAVIFFSMPITVLNIVTTGTDVGWACLHVASAVALLRALSRPSTRGWIAAGLLTGLSASCKYPGFPYIPIAGVLVLWSRKGDAHEPWPAALREVLIFLTAATLMVVPVLVRNVAFHQNPLYPFGGTVWGTPRITPLHWQIFVSDANSRVLKDVFSSGPAFRLFLLHPWITTMQGQSNSDFLGPLYLLLLPLLFLFKSPRPGYTVLRRYAALLWLLWMCTSTSPRYGLPALALAALLMAEAVQAGFTKMPWKIFALGLVLVGALSNLNYAALFEVGHEGWRVVAGEQTEDEFLSEMRQGYPTPPYDAIRWMNENLPKESKILYAGEARCYFSNLAAVPSSVPDPQPLVAWSEESPDAAALAARLRAEGVTHIFLNFMEATRTESYHLFTWDEKSWPVFQTFWNRYIQLAWKSERLVQGNPKALYVYTILPEAQAAQPHAPPPDPFERWAPKPQHS